MAITQLESSTLSNVTSATFTTFSTDHKLHLFKFWEIKKEEYYNQLTKPYQLTQLHRFGYLEFYKLKPYPDAPEMPYGYLTMIYLVLLFPFLYNRIMK